MSALRGLWRRVFGVGMLQWLGAGAGQGGIPSVTPPDLRAHDDEDQVRLSEREREIELRLLMSNWM